MADQQETVRYVFEGDVSSLTKSVSSALKQLGNITAGVTKINTGLRSMTSVTNIASKALATMTGIKLGDWLANAAKESIKYTENLNLFTVAMGDAIEESTKFIDTMQEIYGMDPSNLMRYAGNFYQLSDAIDMPAEAATNLSLVLTKATNDIASLFNVDIDTVFQDLSSGMQGMSRAVRKYGMDIRTTTLQQTALSLGITEQVETMSEANRQGLRFLTMMRQASNASGDFARTIETPANQLRIFREQMTQLGRAIGNFFIVPLANAIAYINGFVMALRTVLTYVAEVLGLLTGFSVDFDTSAAEDEAAAIESIGSAAGSAAAEMKNLIAPFDELNVLQESKSSGGGGGGGAGLGSDVLDPAISQAITDFEYKLENIKMKANQVRDAILEFLGFTVDFGKIISWDPSEFEANLIDKFPQWTQSIQALFDNWTSIVDGFKAVFEAMGGVVENVFNKIKGFASTFINDDTVSVFIENLAGNLENLASWITENEDTLANFVLVIGGIWTAFSAFTGLAPILSILINFISALVGVAGAVAPFVSTIGLIAGAIGLLYINSATFATSFNDLIDTFIDGLGPMFESAAGLLESIWSGIQELWDQHIQPLISQTGDALAPVLDTIGTLWSTVSSIIASAIDTIRVAWETVLVPIFGMVVDSIGTLMGLFKELWENVLGPIIEHIADSLGDLWDSSIQPVVSKIIEIVGKVIELILTLWNNVFAPMISWFINQFGPAISSIFNTVWDIISNVFNSIMKAVGDVLTVFGGVLDFLIGVFTGDWERAWKGIVNIFVGVGNGIITTIEGAVNGIIGLINLVIDLVYNAIVTFINSILGTVEDIASVVGIDLNLKITSPPPAIPYQSWPRIPELATGGVVTAPTYAKIGEGLYSEAIIPLDNSPQMMDFIQKIVDAIDSKPDSSQPVEVKVYVGGEEFDAYTYKAAKRGEKKVGKQPIEVGG